MQLIFYYVGFMALGDVADYLIGLLVERVWPSGEPADLFGALFCLPVDCLAAGGEGDRAESQQASRELIFVIRPAANAYGFAAAPSGRAFRCLVLPMGASARPHLCKAGMNIQPRWKRRRTCVKFVLLG